MATKLDKPVVRETAIPSLLLGRIGKPIIVTLYPDGRIGMREKGRQMEYTLDLQLLYHQAAIADAELRKAAKRSQSASSG